MNTNLNINLIRELSHVDAWQTEVSMECDVERVLDLADAARKYLILLYDTEFTTSTEVIGILFGLLSDQSHLEDLITHVSHCGCCRPLLSEIVTQMLHDAGHPTGTGKISVMPESETPSDKRDFATVLSAEADKLVKADSQDARQFIEENLSKIEQEFSWAEAAGALTLVIDLARTIHRYYWWTLRPDTDNYLGRALYAAKEMRDRKAIADMLWARCDLARRLDNPEAAALGNRALDLYHSLNDTAGIARCQKAIADIYRVHDGYSHAVPWYHEALGNYRTLGDLVGQANCHKGLGSLYLQICQLVKADEHLQIAERLYSQTGDVLGRANTYIARAGVDVRRSLCEEAEAKCKEAIKLYERLGASKGLSDCYRVLGDQYFLRGDRKTALDFYQKVANNFEKLHPSSRGSKRDRAWNMLAVAEINRRMHNFAQARCCLEEARKNYEAIRSYRGIAHCLIAEAGILRKDPELEEADRLDRSIKLYQEALDMLNIEDSPHLVADCQRGMAQSFLDRGCQCNDRDDLEEAIRWFKPAEALYIGLQNSLGRAVCLQKRGDALMQLGATNTAAECFQQARILFEAFPNSCIARINAAQCGRDHQKLAGCADEPLVCTRIPRVRKQDEEEMRQRYGSTGKTLIDLLKANQ